MHFKNISHFLEVSDITSFRTAVNKKTKKFHNDTVCFPTLLNSTDEHFWLCSVCERLKVRGERWKDSLAVEGWGERGISVKVRLIGHTVTADAHLVSAWRCCGKPDRVTHEYTTWWAAWSFKAYWHQMQQNVSFIDRDALYMPVLVFTYLHLANLIMQ